MSKILDYFKQKKKIFVRQKIKKTQKLVNLLEV